MTDVLKKEITGELVTVEIRGSVRPLAYPMHNVILYKQKTGDSLFDAKAWPLIDLSKDPERWLACLWAGLHEQQSDKSWKSPSTIEELGALVDFGNASEISIAMVKALTSFMPKAKDPVPNGAAPGEPAQSQPEPSPTSGSSGLELVAATASAATNF
jgi:hypothetical protein